MKDIVVKTFMNGFIIFAALVVAVAIFLLIGTVAKGKISDECYQCANNCLYENCKELTYFKECWGWESSIKECKIECANVCDKKFPYGVNNEGKGI